jgi:hypothetical protein
MELPEPLEQCSTISLGKKATQMNYQTEYLEDNAITKKEYPNFPIFICFFVTQIGFAQFTIQNN